MVPALLAALLLAPPFASSIQPVTARQLPYSWHAGCPVGPADLRLLRLSYWGFDGKPHTGRMVVHRTVAGRVVVVFRKLYDARFPLRRMRLVDAYEGSDKASMAADNTSAFNCRFALTSGPKHWSMHAYGRAIDVNTVENPYVWSGGVSPPAGRAYLDRSRARPGMAVEGSVLVRAFDAAGFGWGGRWSGAKDYQHFSTNGR